MRALERTLWCGVEEAQEHEFDEEDGSDALVTIAAVKAGDLGAREGEADDGQHAAQWAVLADALPGVDPVAEELRRRLVDAHHTQDRIARAPGFAQRHFRRRCDLGNTPSRCARFNWAKDLRIALLILRMYE